MKSTKGNGKKKKKTTTQSEWEKKIKLISLFKKEKLNTTAFAVEEHFDICYSTSTQSRKKKKMVYFYFSGSLLKSYVDKENHIQFYSLFFFFFLLPFQNISVLATAAAWT